MVWYPPACLVTKPVLFTPRPWFPIRAFVNDWVVASPVPAGEAPVDLPPASTVVRLGGFRHFPEARLGGHVYLWGLFPATDLGASILLAALGSPSRWGTWALLLLELAALWDVPILVSNSLLESTDLEIIRGFCASAPAKVLFAGADTLLTTLFRGGCKVLDADDPGLRPDSNEDLGLAPPLLPRKGGRGGITISMNRLSRGIFRSRTGLPYRITFGSTLPFEAMARKLALTVTFLPSRSPPRL